jgi:hypothetical protein
MRRILIGCSCLLIGAFACEQGDSESDASPPRAAAPPSDTLAPAPNSPAARPATRRVAISIEGMVDSMEVRLVRSPEGWAPPFSTYRPADMLDEATSSDEGNGLRFIANFGGVRNDQAFVHVFIYPATATEADVRRMTEAYVGDRPERVTEARRYTWTLLERPFSGRTGRGERTAGWIGAGQHAGRWFHIATEYPVEYGDGFGPRAARILEEWIWEDDQSRLVQR